MNKDEIAEVRATAKAMREEGYQIAAGTIDRAADALTTLSARVETLEAQVQAAAKAERDRLLTVLRQCASGSAFMEALVAEFEAALESKP